MCSAPSSLQILILFAHTYTRAQTTALSAMQQRPGKRLLGICMIGVAEAMTLGVSLSMDANVLAGIINTSPNS
jgi:hypothetical protein